MGFFKRIADMIGGNRSDDNRFVDIYVMSRRCREPITGRVDVMNELSRDDDGKGYYTRKVLHTTGAKRCFDQVEISLWFNKDKRLADHEVTGGTWLSAEEYDEALAIFNAPPEEESEEESEEEPAEEAETEQVNDESSADLAAGKTERNN